MNSQIQSLLWHLQVLLDSILFQLHAVQPKKLSGEFKNGTIKQTSDNRIHSIVEMHGFSKNIFHLSCLFIVDKIILS